jgi:hypothetical protein
MAKISKALPLTEQAALDFGGITVVSNADFTITNPYSGQVFPRMQEVRLDVTDPWTEAQIKAGVLEQV